MRKKDVCELYPKVTTPNGEVASRMYKDLLTRDGLKYPRPVANMLYAAYLKSNVESQMEAARKPDGSPKYKKNIQGQFNAKDYIEFIDFDKTASEWSDLATEEYRMGATDAVGGNRIDFTDAEIALQKVDNFNNNHKGLVATVKEHYTPTGTIYNILVYRKDSRTVDLPINTKERLQAWQIYQQVFNNAGVDITAMPAELSNVFSAYNINMGDNLKNLTMLSMDNMYIKDIMTLLYIDKDSQEVKRVINSFGSIEDAALALDDYNHKNNSIQQNQMILLKRAISHARQLHGVDIDALRKQISQLQSGIKAASPEIAIRQEIDRLNKKYHIEKNEVNRLNSKIKSLSDANAEAAVQLQRRIDELYREKGTSTEGRQLELILNKLLNELSYKHYYSGIIDYLGEAVKGIQEIDSILNNLPQNGTEADRIIGTMKRLQDIKRIRDQYLSIVTALASDKTTMDEAISQIDIDNIRQKAQDLKDFFDKKNNIIDELTKKTVHDFMRLATNGKLSESELSDLMEKAVKEANWGDRWLYSIGTASNIFIAASGTIIRNQEIDRDQKMKSYRLRVDRATDKLYKAGFNTKFMYEDEKHIVSDIDWTSYETVRKAKIKSFKAAGLKGFDFKQALEDWEKQNTEDRLVDASSGRTERVPNQLYRKATDYKDGWSKEQEKYYDAMMQIKGELESLYPAYAQNYYLPPQVRRNMVDGIANAKNTKDVAKAIGNKAKDIFTVREDDTDYAENGIVGGEEVTFTSGNYNNTLKKEVPIYFQNPIEEGELLLDFSAGIMRIAGSAINYSAMMNIRDVLEAVRDYVDEKNPRVPNNATEVVDNAFSRVTKTLYQWGRKNNVAEIIQGAIDQHIYGIKKDNQGLPNWMSKATDSIIGYTSFKGLAFNAPGATANALMGINQIFIDAGCGEFFGWKDIAWATTKLFGETGATGDVMQLMTNNVSHKSALMRDMFDPMQEGFENDKNKRYHSSIFRQLIAHDCSFMGYGVGEYFIHMLPMYAILHREQVMLNGNKISLYDAFEVTPKQDGNSELVPKNGVTDLDGNPLTKAYIDKIKGKIRYANRSMHGAMNAEDRGLIYKYMMGRLVMNFRQWMVGHYSRRFRGKHFDFSIGDWREGYWVSLWKGLMNDDTKETWKEGQKKDAVWMFMKDFASFMFKSSSQWSNLTPMQRYNVKRVRTEMLMFVALTGLSFALGDPDRHKKEFWRRWWIYQTKRMLTETEASMPGLGMPNSILTILQSPMAGINTLNSMMYVLYGLFNGDIMEDIQSGKHKGENRYIRNVIKYDLPFFKDWERLQTMDEDDTLYKVFDYSPSNH